MCPGVDFLSTYVECAHTVPVTSRGCTNPQACGPHARQIMVNILRKFCPSCFLTYHDPRTTPNYHRTSILFQVPTPSGVAFGPKELTEAEQVLHRATNPRNAQGPRPILAIVREIQRSKGNHLKLSKVAHTILAKILWLLNCRFWHMVHQGKPPCLGERMLILELEAINNLEGELEETFRFYPPSPSQYFRTRSPFQNAPPQNNGAACQICTTVFGTPNEQGRIEHAVVANCGWRHVYGFDCLLQWFDTAVTCPMDRCPILPHIPNMASYNGWVVREIDIENQSHPIPPWLMALFHNINPVYLRFPDLIFPEYDPTTLARERVRE